MSFIGINNLSINEAHAMSNEPLRLFIAIPIPVNVKGLITEKINSLQIPLKFIPAENFHITVLFMGNVSVSRLEECNVILQTITKDVPCFTLELDSIVARSNRHQHMLWVNFIESPPFVHCAAIITKALGFTLSRKPLPHINLIRSKKKIQGSFPLRLDPLSFEVNSIEVWKSALSQNGSTYSSLASFPLKGK
jgi:2'-5' RNA ligase